MKDGDLVMITAARSDDASLLTTKLWAERLRGMTGRIDSFFLPLESVFLSTGSRLRDLHGTVSQLSDAIDFAGSLFSSPDMVGMLDELADAARNIVAMRKQRGGLAATLGQMITATGAMIGSLNALGRIMNHSLVLAINAKIEASQLVCTGNDFTVFTRDIARLAKAGGETIAAVRQELSGLRAAATKAQTLQHEFETKELPKLDQVAERLAVSVQGLRCSQVRAEQGAREIPAQLRALFGHISNLVSSLQVYDTTRQRLEHIEQALGLAAVMIEAEGESSMDPQQQQVFVNGIAELQSLQLVHASEHYHDAVSNVGRSVAAMAQGVPAVAELCQRSFGGGDSGSLLDINHDLDQASQVFANFIAIRHQAAGSLELVVKAAAQASELMRSLNSVSGDMRLMGLNAAIKCGNMGYIGRALSVIAQELQSYATLTRDHVQIVTGHLGQISSSGRDIVSTDKVDAGEIDAEALKQEIDRVVSRLQITGKGLVQALERIATSSQSVVTQTQAAEEGFSRKADCRLAMGDSERELKALARDTNTGLTGAALEEARRDVLAFTESHYTMASERSVHGVAIDGRKAVELLTGADVHDQESGGAAGGEQEPDISDLLF
ncbi:MAG: hypothetical protein WCK65_10830 [Rhodospirillaceae bacterium]